MMIMGQVMAGTFDDSSFLSKERKEGMHLFSPWCSDLPEDVSFPSHNWIQQI